MLVTYDAIDHMAGTKLVHMALPPAANSEGAITEVVEEPLLDLVTAEINPRMCGLLFCSKSASFASPA